MNDHDYDNFDENICLNMLSIFFLIKLFDIDSWVEIIAELDIFDKIDNVSSLSFLRRQRKDFKVKILKEIDMSEIDEKMMSKIINFVENDFVDSL